MKAISVRAPAKINLGLSVGPVREDGFHELATVYLALDLHDVVRVTPREDEQITVDAYTRSQKSPDAGIPLGPDNLAVRAVELLREATGVRAGLDLVIEKNIPVAGGMAGGSADAAAALVGANVALELGLTRDDLEPLAAQLGSDVPFLLHGGIAVGTGRGEQVMPVLARGRYSFLIAVSDTGLSTPEVYREYDRLVPDPEPPGLSSELMTALRSGDTELLSAFMVNDLEPAALSLRPELDEVLQCGLDAGAAAGIVSGSGPTCVFLLEPGDDVELMSVELWDAPGVSAVVTAHGPAQGVRVIG
ncbi:MAG: 4-(cytidine 5'-diphospho)-2-C-methyl-D-erythritol kinase [Aeromicrobium sp.]|uniref:4-(cytidine 5'-diphospho)-2-C-methyl-D-erythritol kinase n=1 Tax=Aeromicrobium sp. TaxID=1871063 RepID=UPI0039E47EFE